MDSTERALSALKRIKPRIEQKRESLDADVAYRDACILALLAAGWTEREVSEVAGVTSVRVHQIKKEHEHAIGA